MGQFLSADLSDLEFAARSSSYKRCVEVLEKRPDLNPFTPVFTRDSKKYSLKGIEFLKEFILPTEPPLFPSKSSLEYNLIHRLTKGMEYLKENYNDLFTKRTLPLDVEPTKDSIDSKNSNNLSSESMFSLARATEFPCGIAMAPFAWAIDLLHCDMLRLFLSTPHFVSPIAIAPIYALPLLFPTSKRGVIGLNPLSYWISLHLCDHLYDPKLLDRIDEICLLLLEVERLRFSPHVLIDQPIGINRHSDNSDKWYWCAATNRTVLHLAIYYENHYSRMRYLQANGLKENLLCRHSHIVPFEGRKLTIRDDSSYISPMCHAQQWKQKRLVELLMNHPDIEWTILDSETHGNILHHTINYGSYEVLGMIVEHEKFKKVRKELLETRDYKDRTCLDLALELGLLDRVKLLISVGAKYKAVCPRTGMSVLSFLIQRKNDNEVSKVLELIDIIERKRVWEPKAK